MAAHFKRTQILVNRRVQGRVILRVLYLWAMYHLVLWHVMLFFRFIQYCAERLGGGATRTFGDLFAEFVHNHYSMLICGVIVLPYLIWDVLKLTHRFVGPLVQFQKCLAGLARGEKVADVRIRKGDLLGELENSFNEFLHSPYAPGNGSELLAAQSAEPSPAAALCDDADAVKVDVEDIQGSIAGHLAPAEHTALSR
jgi:hypothetical protein